LHLTAAASRANAKVGLPLPTSLFDKLGLKTGDACACAQGELLGAALPAVRDANLAESRSARIGGYACRCSAWGSVR
jgi:NADH-quinone oxidoreductase subunit G